MSSAAAPSEGPRSLELKPGAAPADGRVVLDLAVGTTAAVATATVAVVRRSSRLVAPVVRIGLHPPLLPARRHPATLLGTLAEYGGRQRRRVGDEVSRLLDVLVPRLAPEVLRRLDLTTLVGRYVDIDALVTGVDLDAAAARLDVDAVAARLEVDTVAARLNIAAVLDRLDLTALVRERVDLDSLVGSVDLDAIAARLDVDAVAARLDIDAVIDRIDLVGLAEEVIEAIDLPEIIRESSGAVASDTVRSVRMQGVAGDEAVGRVFDRLLRRSNRPSSATDGASAQALTATELAPPDPPTVSEVAAPDTTASATEQAPGAERAERT